MRIPKFCKNRAGGGELGLNPFVSQQRSELLTHERI